MKIHLPWIRVTATAVLVAGVGVHEAAAQYAPIGQSRNSRPHPPRPPQPRSVPVVAGSATPQQPYYTAYRTPAGGSDASRT